MTLALHGSVVAHRSKHGMIFSSSMSKEIEMYPNGKARSYTEIFSSMFENCKLHCLFRHRNAHNLLRSHYPRILRGLRGAASSQ